MHTRVYLGYILKVMKEACSSGGSERVIFTLPKQLAAELEEYAGVLRGGNKSGFVADAVRAYIDHFRRLRHTERWRRSYAAAAGPNREIAREWEGLDDTTWKRLDALEAKAKKR